MRGEMPPPTRAAWRLRNPALRRLVWVASANGPNVGVAQGEAGSETRNPVTRLTARALRRRCAFAHPAVRERGGDHASPGLWRSRRLRLRLCGEDVGPPARRAGAVRKAHSRRRARGRPHGRQMGAGPRRSRMGLPAGVAPGGGGGWPEPQSEDDRGRQSDLVVAFPGGEGTEHMVRLAKAANIEVLEVPWPPKTR